MLKTDARIFVLLVLLLLARGAGAATCADVWPGAMTANGTVAPTLPAFTGSSALTLSRTLAAGDFHYSSSSIASGTLTTSSATTRLYFNGSLSLSGTTLLNGGGNPQNLIVIVNGSLSLANSARINGLVYATGSITLANTASITGAATAAGGIATSGSSSVTYSETGVVGASYGTLCTPPVQPALKIVSPICSVSNKLIVTFNSSGGRLPLGSSATTLGNYSLVSETGTVHTITGARLSDEGYEVQLTFTPTLVNGRDYTLSVANVKDQDGITMVSASDGFFFSSTTNGIVGNYWGNTTLSGAVSSQSVDSNINFAWDVFDWPAGSFLSGFSIRWDGYLEVPTTGTYTLRTVSEDGARVWLNDLAGSAVINRWVNTSGTATSSGLALVAGQRYPVKVEFFKEGEAFSTKEMRLQWTTPASSTFTAVPNANLYTCVSSFVSNTGLVAHYQLEGPTWNGTSGEVTDSSGNNMNGTTIGNPTASAAKVCNGAYMNGTNYIRIADNPLMDLTDALTITAWIRLNAVGAELKSIFSKDENYEFHINNSRQVYWWWNNSGGTTRSFSSPVNSIALNTWHHIGVVYSSTRQSIYIDGVERAFTTYSGEILRTNNDPMEIGADQGLADRIWNGGIDEIKLYDRALSAAEVTADMNATRVCPSSLDRFEVSVAATASVCAPVAVTIRALQSNGSTYTGYVGTVNISTSAAHGNWSKTNAVGAGTATGTLNPVTDSDDNGAVQYTFASGDSGQAILYLSNTHADRLTITSTENGGTATGTSSAVQFSENALQVNNVDSLGSDFVAGRNHALQVEALRRDPVTGACGRFTAYNGNIALKTWITRNANDPGGVRPFISTASGNVQLPTAQPGSTNATLAFNQGLASLNWITSDVGQYVFNLRDDSSGLVVDTSGAPLPITGTSATFTVRPFGFYTRAQSRRVPVTSNPAPNDAAGAAFVKAGENFDVLATAVQYESADDSNVDGVPDAGADLSGNGTAPAFGQEPAGVRDTVALSSTLVLPSAAGSVHPGLSGATSITSFSSGAGSAITSYGEVGIISISAALADNSYLGSSNVTGNIPRVGRFYPDHFTAAHNSPTLRDGSGSWSCDFTYQGQPFGFATEPQVTFTAVNTSGNPTLNYTGDFWKLDVPQHGIALDASSPPAGSACISSGAVVAGCFSENSASVARSWSGTDSYDGQGVFFTGSHVLQINKLNAMPNAGDVPYPPRVDLVLPAAEITDNDGACYLSGGSCSEFRIDDISGTDIRYGRGWIDNTNGPVMTPLIMTLRLQYWDASANFVYNTLDNAGCSGTPALTTDIQLSNFTGNLQAGETSVAALSAQPGYYLASLAAPGSDSSGQPNAGTAIVTWLLDNDTSDNAPGEACSQHWLCYDYDGNGLNENPAARAIFSTLPDKRPLLFLKEAYR